MRRPDRFLAGLAVFCGGGGAVQLGSTLGAAALGLAGVVAAAVGMRVMSTS